MRVIFLGTPDFAVPSLCRLCSANEVEVVGVITQPDRPAGRGRQLTAPPVKKLALELGIPVYQPGRIKDNPEVLQWALQREPEIMIVVAFGQILPLAFFNLPPLGTLNVHASLLPKYRGAAPVIHAILNGETVSGVTIMKLDEGMDTGDILSQEEVAIPPDMTAGELEKLLAERGADLLLRTIHPYAEGRITPQPQDHELATYAPRVSTEQARINWMRPATEIHNQVRAFNPRPGAFTTLRGESVKIWRTTVSGRELEHDQPPGTIIELQPELLVCCGGSPQLLSIQELQVANRSSVSAREFINGMRLVVGERFLQ
ncbi:MAG TPA: methionyl-tRNA formyltransferase [Acidobacteriota bacterium]|nr:methionyl-tRNA formyltransferase [Acidobacteriota bacterium]